MILPIVPYGDPVLRERAQPVPDPTSAEMQALVADMYETMYGAHGVGLAAPQIGQSIRLFVVDGSQMEPPDDWPEEDMAGFKQVFFNPELLQEEGAKRGFEEGCLSIPGVRDTVKRPPSITLRYQDAEGNEHTEEFTGLKARILQHEYDHLEGVLFTDYASSLRKKLLKGKLNRITRGDVDAGYPMRPIGKSA